MARGGRRAGRSGKAYAQRSDLNSPKAKLAIVTPHSDVYGQAEKLRRAQQAVPMGGQPAPVAPMQASQPSATPPTAQPSLGPGDLGPLTAPTQRPDEPLTAGMPTGAGPGPEVLAQFPQNPVLQGLAALNAVNDDGLPELRAVRAALNAHADNQMAP